ATLHPDAIVTGQGEPAILALKKATTTVPIVMLLAADPVGTGLVASLARPGANVTGMSLLAPDLGGKRLAMLKEAVATASRGAGLGEGSRCVVECRVSRDARGVQRQRSDSRRSQSDTTFGRGTRAR